MPPIMPAAIFGLSFERFFSIAAKVSFRCAGGSGPGTGAFCLGGAEAAEGGNEALPAGEHHIAPLVPYILPNRKAKCKAGSRIVLRREGGRVVIAIAGREWYNHGRYLNSSDKNGKGGILDEE